MGGGRDSSDEEILGTLCKRLGVSAETSGAPEDDVSDDDGSALTCDFCLEIADPSDLSKHRKYGYKRLHMKCFNGLHALERIASKNPKVKAELQSVRYKDEVRFKSIAMPLVFEKKRERDQGSRMQTADMLDIILVKSTIKRKGKSILMEKC
eukprot:5329880-Pyramimonas_sp.AAC.2